jgi:ABC-type lipoprotein release transport system permease subunit
MNGAFRVLLQMALRNLLSHKVKSLIVGAIMMFGTFLLVLGTAMLDSVEESMARSIISSVAGHIQVYSSEAEDKLALFGGLAFGAEDFGEIKDYSKVGPQLETIPNVKAAVPMGIGVSVFNASGDLDRAFLDLDSAIKAGEPQRLKASQARTREILKLMREERETSSQISRDEQALKDAKAVLDEALSDDFWRRFDADPAAQFVWLENKVGPLGASGRLLYMRYLGTDLGKFQTSFDRFEVVDGERVPEGRPGVLLSKRFYEKVAKNKVAKEFDEIHEAVVDGERVIATDQALQDSIKRNARQYRDIVFQLNGTDASFVEGELRKLMPQAQGDLSALLQQFLTVDDANIRARYEFFYKNIAPRILLYSVAIGDVITLRSFSKTGYIRAVNVKVYGTYRFKGMETSDLAGATNLLDLMTFRQLYGQFTEAQKQEMEEIRKEVGVKEVDRASAEDALFGGGGELVEVKAEDDGKELFEAKPKEAVPVTKLEDVTFTQAELDEGMVINVAVLLKDPDKMDETLADIERLSKEKGLKVQALDWQTASGLIGQIILMVRAVLYVAIFIIFLVALVIINNSMVMATMERVQEIGTMRAIGAQRSFILWLFLLETTFLGLLGGGAGAALGAGIVTLLGVSGISAGGNDFLTFLFSGPSLYPSVGLQHLVLGFVVILLVTMGATFYPALLAARIQPVVAMQRKE